MNDGLPHRHHWLNNVPFFPASKEPNCPGELPEDMRALVIGGTRFIGPRAVADLLDHGYDVTVFNRGNSENPFPNRVDNYQGDRTDRTALKAARDTVEPDIVIDLVAYHPAEVRDAVAVFDSVESYVFVSSAAAYRVPTIPLIEGETPLLNCTDTQATDDSGETYGARKAECDRIVFDAAERGVNAVIVRPCVVYGPNDHSERLDYWIHQVLNQDRVLIPGDGTNVMHRVYVDDVASALRLAAENGEPGAAYNCGDRQAVTLDRTVQRIADAARTDVEPVHASERELGEAASFADFPLYTPYPFVLDTDALADIGWESTPLRESMEATVDDHRESDRDGSEFGPDDEATILDALVE